MNFNKLKTFDDTISYSFLILGSIHVHLPHLRVQRSSDDLVEPLRRRVSIDSNLWNGLGCCITVWRSFVILTIKVVNCVVVIFYISVFLSVEFSVNIVKGILRSLTCWGNCLLDGGCVNFRKTPWDYSVKFTLISVILRSASDWCS